MPPRKRLGQLLTELHVVDEHQLHSALGHQKQWGGKLGAILVQKGFCKEDQVVSALATHLGMPVVKLSTQKVDPRAVKLVTRPIAEKLHVFAYEVTGSGRGEVVTIAMSDPTDLSAVDQLAFHTGKRIKPMLCGDSEIVNAIVANYGDSQPAPKPAAPAAVAPPAPATPSATQAFPKRIEPNQPPAAPPPAPYVPPPIPPRPARPAPALEEIEPVDPDSFANIPPARPAARQEPLELSESDGAADGRMEGLEPIAAQVQAGGDEVAGQEEVAGDGTAADALEGLEAASEATRHEGADGASMEGLERSDAQPSGSAWDAAPAGESSEWGTTPEGGWDAAPAAEPEAPAAEVESGWGEPEAAAQPAAEGETPQWDAAPDVAWETAQSDWGAAGEPQDEAGADHEAGAEQEAGHLQSADEQSEELPADAIIGTADALEGEGWGEAAPPAEPGAEEAAGELEVAAAAEEPADAPAADAEPSQEHDAALAAPEASNVELHEAEAPDAWATSEDPLAAGQEAAPETPWGEAAPQEEQAGPEQAWAAQPDAWAAQDGWSEPPAEAAPAAEADHTGWPQDENAEQSAEGGHQPDSLESPSGEGGPGLEDQHSAGADAGPFGEAAGGETPAEELHAAAFGAGGSHEEQTAEQEARSMEPEAGEAVHGGGDHEELPVDSSDPERFAAGPEAVGLADGETHAESVADEPQAEIAADAAPLDDPGAGEPEASGFKDGDAHALPDAAGDASAGTAESSAQGFASESAAEESAAEGATAAFEETLSAEPTLEEEQLEQAEPGLEGWVSPPPEPPAVGAGWLGEALAATLPLSAADLQTLSAVGVDANDGVGALRLLASLLRVLHQRGAIDFDELAAELAQSRDGASAPAPLVSEDAL